MSTKRSRPGALRIMGAVLALSLVTAACGGDDDDATNEQSAATTTGGATTQAGATTAAAPASDVDPEGVLRVGVDLEASGGLRFDPTKMSTGQYIWSTPVLRSPLVRQEDGTLKPDLAESARVIDSSTVEVVLRAGLKFSDGTPLDWAAVKATFERNLASANAAALQVGDMALVDTITLDSPTTFTIKLKQPSAALIYAQLAGVEFAPMSPASFASAAADGSTAVGAGPMMIESYTKGTSVTFVKNPNYWDAEHVTLAGMEYVHTAPGAAVANGLRSDAIDYAVILNDQAAGMTAPLTVSQHTMTAPMLMQWCMKAGTPLGDVKVRQAIAYAIDREAYNKAIFRDKSEIAWDLWPSDSPWHNNDLDDMYSYDVAKAKALLTEAGYPNGFDFTVHANTAVVRDLEVIQAQLAEVGIKMSLVPSTNPLDYYQDVKMDATYSQGRPGPLDKISRHFLSTSFSNACKFPSPQADALYQQLVGLPLEDPNAIELWQQLETLVVRDLAWMPMTVFQQHIVAYNADRVGDVVFYYDQLGGRQPDPVGTYIKAD